MSRELDNLLESASNTAIINQEEILEVIREFGEQSISIFKPRKLQGSNYNFVVNIISSGYGLSRDEMKNLKIKELIYLLNEARNVSYFKCEEEEKRHQRTLLPAGITGRVAVMMNEAYRKDYLIRRFLKISYSNYLQLMYAASERDMCMKIIIHTIEDMVRKNRQKIYSSKGGVITIKDILRGYTDELGKVFVPGIKTAHEFDENMKEWSYVMYRLFVEGLVAILNLKDKCSVSDIVEKYGRKINYDWSLEELLNEENHKEK